MTLEAQFKTALSTVNAIDDDEKAVDQLLNTVKASEAEDTDENDEKSGDEVVEVKNLTTYSDLEYEIKQQEFITNPAATWDFAKPVIVIFPHSLKGTVNAVHYAEENHLQIKALGARHSFSLVPATDDCYIDLSKTFSYSRALHNTTIYNLDQTSLDHLADHIDRKNYFDVPGGLKIHMLNHILCPDNNDVARFGRKRMFNMGGGDVQTFAGAFSTGTHGSGGKYSAYHDMVRSIVVVASEGKVYRVEPTNGITNPLKHQAYYNNHPEKIKIELIQDNDKFYSLLVSMGCFGIIYSAIIEITDMNWLHSEATYFKAGWNKEFKQKFEKPILPADPADEYFYYILLNPYKLKRKKNPSILVKEVWPTANPGSGKRETRRKLWPSLFANWPLSVNFIRHISNSGLMPRRRLIESALKSQNDNKENKGKGYTDLAYKIWNSGSGKMISIGAGIEVAFPAKEIPEVMDLLLDTIEKIGGLNRGYCLNAPIALRFVRASNAYLAPNYHEYKGAEVAEWCYIELLRVNSKEAADDEREMEVFKHFQLMLTLKGGRPHWGLNFRFNFDKPLLSRLYPQFNKWLESYRFFNTKDTFENEFARNAGLTEKEEQRV